MTLRWGRGQTATALVLGLLASGVLAGCGEDEVAAPPQSAVETFRSAATRVCDEALDGLKAPPAGDLSLAKAGRWARRADKELEELQTVLGLLIAQGKKANADIVPLQATVIELRGAARAAGKREPEAVEPMQRSIAELQKSAAALGVPACAPA